MCVRAHFQNFASNTGTPKLKLYEPFTLLYYRALDFENSFCKTHFPVLSHPVNSFLKHLDLLTVCLNCTHEARTLLNWDQLQTLAIASRVPRVTHMRIPLALLLKQTFPPVGYLPCPPADSLLLRTPLTCEDALKHLSSDEWLSFWLCWSSYHKSVACVQLAQHVTLLLFRAMISSLLTVPSFHVTLVLSPITGLSMHFTSDKIYKRNRNKTLLSHLCSWTTKLRLTLVWAA